MWYPLNSNPPHTALHLSVKDVPPRILNRAVNRLMDQTSTTYDLEPPFRKLASATAVQFGPNVNVGGAKVAYGKWAVPKLRRELHHDSPVVVHEAVATLMELVHDPKRCYEIIDEELIARIADLLVDEDQALRQKCVTMIATVAGLSLGREAVTNCQPVMDALATLMRDSCVTVRLRNAVALEMLSRSPFGAASLNEHKFVQKIVRRVFAEDVTVLAVHMVTLEALLEAGAAVKQEAIDYGAAKALYLMLDHSCDEILARVLANMALLLENQEAKDYGEQVDMMAKLAKLLEHKSSDVYTNAALTVMHLTTTTATKLRAVQLGVLPRLLDLAGRFRQPELQVYAIKCLTNLCAVPAARQELMDNHQAYVEELECGGRPFVTRHRDILLKAMRWKP